jgi:hypothetical protein
VVFDEHDHRTLDELEWHLSMEDPEFVGRFDRGQQRMSAQFRQRRGNRIALATAVSVGGLLLLLGTAAGAVAAMLTIGLVWLAWRYPNLFIGSSPS